MIIIYVAIYIVIVVICAEIWAYLWHRFASHTDIVPGLHITHRMHHNAPLNHHADEDFVWVLFALVTAGMVLTMLVLYKILDAGLAALSLSLILAVFMFNWYINGAFHTEGHPWNQHQWFQLKKRDHFVHHDNPKANFGIASNFTDMIMGTYQHS